MAEHNITRSEAFDGQEHVQVRYFTDRRGVVRPWMWAVLIGGCLAACVVGMGL